MPDLTNRLRRDLFDTVDDDSPSVPPSEQQLPAIIEIPDWALRIEQRLAAAKPTKRSQEQLPLFEESPQQKGAGESEDTASESRTQKNCSTDVVSLF